VATVKTAALVSVAGAAVTVGGCVLGVREIIKHTKNSGNGVVIEGN
jgi:hypothetical protein